MTQSVRANEPRVQIASDDDKWLAHGVHCSVQFSWKWQIKNALSFWSDLRSLFTTQPSIVPFVHRMPKSFATDFDKGMNRSEQIKKFSLIFDSKNRRKNSGRSRWQESLTCSKLDEVTSNDQKKIVHGHGLPLLPLCLCSSDSFYSYWQRQASRVTANERFHPFGLFNFTVI